MAEKKATEIKLSDDVQVIRNILFGEHLNDMQNRIAALEQAVHKLEEENQELRKLIQAESGQRKQAVKQIDKKMGEVKTTLLGEITSSEDRMNAHINQIRKDQNTQSEQFRGDLDIHSNKLSNLISTLASALVEYQHDNSNPE